LIMSLFSIAYSDFGHSGFIERILNVLLAILVILIVLLLLVLCRWNSKNTTRIEKRLKEIIERLLSLLELDFRASLLVLAVILMVVGAYIVYWVSIRLQLL
jgi:hypothetical protein